MVLAVRSSGSSWPASPGVPAPAWTRNPQRQPPKEVGHEHVAIVMMVVAILVVWGGLAVAIWSLRNRRTPSVDEVHRDL